jgi:hypothetical protein
VPEVYFKVRTTRESKTMSMRKKPEREIRLVRHDELKQGEIRHKQGLSPLLTELARDLFRRGGHYLYPSFEQWELGFMRDMHPWREILLWEAICRAYEAYVGKHPEAANDTKIIATIAAISVGITLEKMKPEKLRELQELFQDAWGKRWIPSLELPLEFPEDAAIVLQYGEIICELDGQLYPNLNRKIDPRHVIARAEIVLGFDDHSDGGHLCLYGLDIVEQASDGKFPWGTRILAIPLDTQNTETNEWRNIMTIIRIIKGRQN